MTTPAMDIASELSIQDYQLVRAGVYETTLIHALVDEGAHVKVSQDIR